MTSSFLEYCKTNKVKRLSHNQAETAVKPTAKTLKKAQSNRNDLAVSSHDYFFDTSLENSVNEFYIDGQKHLPKLLRSGKFKIIASIDLHQHTQKDALFQLTHFLSSKITSGNTCIKIIHGKGLGSINNISVLKNMVRHYLEHYNHTLAFSYGSVSQGGDGVTLVKLKTGNSKAF